MRLKQLAVLATALAAVGTAAPAATAGHVTANCAFVAVSNATATGQDTWIGQARGYIIGNAGENVSIRCVVKVNGTVRAATAWGSGTSTAWTADSITYVRAPGQSQQVCAQYTTAHGFSETCRSTETVQALSQPTVVFIDAIAQATDEYACAKLAEVAGNYGPVEIDATGDTYVNGTLVRDCAPYAGDPWPRGEDAQVYVSYVV